MCYRFLPDIKPSYYTVGKGIGLNNRLYTDYRSKPADPTPNLL